jgi:hypothetical protein
VARGSPEGRQVEATTILDRWDMTKAYLNYPNPHVGLHHDPSCAQVSKMQKPGQRVITVNASSFAAAVAQLQNSSFRMGPSAAVNDLWVLADFGDDLEFEEAVVRYFWRLLGSRYRRLKGTPVKQHC